MSKKVDYEKVRLTVFLNTYCGKEVIKKIRQVNKIPINGIPSEELPDKIKRLFPETYKEYVKFLNGGGFFYPTIWIIQHLIMRGADKLVTRFNFAPFLFKQMVLNKDFSVVPSTPVPLIVKYATPENPITDGYYLQITDESFALKDLNAMKKFIGIKTKRYDVPLSLGKNDIQTIKVVEDKISEVKTLITKKDREFKEMYVKEEQGFSDVRVMEIVFEQVCGDRRTKFKEGQEEKLKNKYYEILTKYKLPNFIDTTTLLELVEQ